MELLDQYSFKYIIWWLFLSIIWSKNFKNRFSYTKSSNSGFPFATPPSSFLSILTSISKPFLSFLRGGNRHLRNGNEIKQINLNMQNN